jgi:hypothetical protein
MEGDVGSWDKKFLAPKSPKGTFNYWPTTEAQRHREEDKPCRELKLNN